VRAAFALARRLPFGGRRALAGSGSPSSWSVPAGSGSPGRRGRPAARRRPWQADGAQLRRQLAAYDLNRRRRDAGPAARALGARPRAHRRPGLGVAAQVPVLGRDLRAGRETGAVLADVNAGGARRWRSALPRLDPHRRAGGQPRRPGRRWTSSRWPTSRTPLPGLSLAVDDGAARLSTVDPDGLRPQVASGVTEVRSLLDAVRGPLAGAGPLTRTLPAMLGASGPADLGRLLQQSAEARGTRRLVGAYGRSCGPDRRRLNLVASRGSRSGPRPAGRPVPTAGVPPRTLRELWGATCGRGPASTSARTYPWTGRLGAGRLGRRTGRPAGAWDYVARPSTRARPSPSLLAGPSRDRCA
jgi:hypothetical protein